MYLVRACTTESSVEQPLALGRCRSGRCKTDFSLRQAKRSISAFRLETKPDRHGIPPGISKALRDITEYAENTDTPQRRAVAIAIRMIDNASRIPALQWIIRSEPDQVIRMWRDQEPPGQVLGRAYISAQLQDEHLNGRLSASRAEFAADVLMRIVMSLVLVPDPEYRKTGLNNVEQYLAEIVDRLLR
ncbi:Uncharacterised protein [Mycobacteroides abscessus subsp. abscessus]|nr:hypothetical protein [Mycobacteroides abscessus]SIL04013.1 Uncharacterised protein [Mycobacteroides abscessus subsp. abscessus]SLE09466.1 Uncharacterised protein [Mycobacteroides abscessus subsp. abscessus]